MESDRGQLTCGVWFVVCDDMVGVYVFWCDWVLKVLVGIRYSGEEVFLTFVGCFSFDTVVAYRVIGHFSLDDVSISTAHKVPSSLFHPAVVPISEGLS
jgi:hypothetical protein